MKRALPICFALFMAGCVATQEFTAFDAASSEKALIRWQRKGRSLVYDAVCARARDGSVLIRLYKQSPIPVGEFRLESDNSFEAAGRLAGRGWVGSVRDAPPVYACWIWFLTAYQKPAQSGALSLPNSTIRVSSTRSGDKLKVLSVSNRETGEVISAIFN
jgi:hypothetical protein